MTRTPQALLVGLALLVGACGDTERDAGSDIGDARAARSAPGDTTVVAAEHAHAAEGEGEALLPIMQSLGAYIVQLTQGLMADDTAMVARGADAIAHHAPISKEELERIHGILGARMAEFERLDEAVHESSVRLHEAAAAGDPTAVLARLTDVQRAASPATHSSARRCAPPRHANEGRTRRTTRAE